MQGKSRKKKKKKQKKKIIKNHTFFAGIASRHPDDPAH